MKRFSLQRLHRWGEVVVTTCGWRGAQRRIGLAPSPSAALPKIAIVGQPTAAAMCNGPASTVTQTFVWLRAPAKAIKEVLPRKSISAVEASNSSSPLPPW